jgi:hypothetical protein
MQSKRPRVLVSGLFCLCGGLLGPQLALAAGAPASAKPSSSGAQSAAPSAKPAEAPPPPKAELVDSSAALAPAAGASPGAAAPSPAVVAEAKQRFDRGLDLYSEGEYPLALIEFTRAYELVPNYRVLYNIAQVGIQLGQYANARRALEEYVQKGSATLSEDRRAGVARDLEMLERRTAFLEIKVNVVGAEVLVDDLVVGKSPLSPALLVDAGVHRISVRHTGYLQRMSRVTLAGGDRQALSLTLERQPETKSTIVVQRAAPEDNTKTLMIAGWVTTGALAAGAIVTGIMGAGEAEELEQLKASDPADYDNLGARLDKTASNANALFLASDVFSAGAVVVGGLSLWITVAPPGGSEEPLAGEKKPAPPPGKPLQVGFEHDQLKLRGSF